MAPEKIGVRPGIRRPVLTTQAKLPKAAGQRSSTASLKVDLEKIERDYVPPCSSLLCSQLSRNLKNAAGGFDRKYLDALPGYEVSSKECFGFFVAEIFES